MKLRLQQQKRIACISVRQISASAFVKVGIGAEKKSRVISEKEKKITAYHEAGHAILFHVLAGCGTGVQRIRLFRRDVGAAGYTMPLPDKDEMFETQGQYASGDYSCTWRTCRRRSKSLDDITTGASQDIKQATATSQDRW